MRFKNTGKKQKVLIDRLTWLEYQVEELHDLLDELDFHNQVLANRVKNMDLALEIHEMDIEYLKANTKIKKGNK